LGEKRPTAADGLGRYLPAWLTPGRTRHLEQLIETVREEASRERKELVRELREIRRTSEQQRERVERALDAHDAVLAALPELQARIERCISVYVQDAKHPARLADFRRGVDTAAVLAHVTSAVEQGQLHLDPCPHLVIDKVFPDDFFNWLVDALPAPLFFEKTSDLRDEMPVPFVMAPAYNRAVWELFHEAIEKAFLPAVIAAFRPALDEFVRASWPSLGSWDESGITLRAANPRLMLRRKGYLIKPHRDPRWAFLVALFYAAPRSAPHTYGTQLYRLIKERDEPHTSPLWLAPEECELARDVPGIGNSALIFLNSTGAHGASVPDDAPADFLRYVYQARFSPDAATKKRLLDLLVGDGRERWVTTR
jgi:hypothetical protein